MSKDGWGNRVITILMALIVSLFTACVAQPTFDPLAAPANAEVVTGKWTGKYTCLQGNTGVTLTLNGSKDGLVEGIFLFYPTQSNLNAATGRFIVRGSYFSDGSLILGGGAWIERPDGYDAVSLRGKVDSALNTFSGVVPECFNTAFSVKKSFQQ